MKNLKIDKIFIIYFYYTLIQDYIKDIICIIQIKLYHQFESKAKDNKLVQRNFQFQFDLNFVIIDVAEIAEETE